MNESVQELTARLSSRDAAAVAASAEALCQLGHEAQPAAVALVRAANAADAGSRAWIAAALEEIGPPAAYQIEELARLLSVGGDVTYWAATLLGRAGPAAATAVEELVALLRSAAEPAARERAAWALGRIGPPATAAVSALHAAAAGDNSRLSRLAKAAEEAISGDRGE